MTSVTVIETQAYAIANHPSFSNTPTHRNAADCLMEGLAWRPLPAGPRTPPDRAGTPAALPGQSAAEPCQSAGRPCRSPERSGTAPTRP